LVLNGEESVIAIIPARGGSKRIPRKNVKSFRGKPILSYSIEAALQSQLFDEVMVSTDDVEIAEIAKRYGAVVPFLRSEKASNDYATTVDVLLEVIDEYRKRGQEFTYVCTIYPTAPLITARRLEHAFDVLRGSGADALMPIVAFSFPPMRGIVNENNRIRMRWPEYTFARSQDIETMYHDSGQFYFIRTDALMREKNLLCRETVPLVLSELEVQDIDNELDWKLAELKYELLQRQGCYDTV